MLSTLIKSLDSNIAYIQIWNNRIKVTNTQNSKVFDETAVMAIDKSNNKKSIIKAIGNEALQYSNSQNIILAYPFEHPRLVLNDFEVAEKIIQHALKQTLSGILFFRPSPKIIIQSMEYSDDLGQIEIRALKELGFGAGGRESEVYSGLPLEVNHLDYNLIKSQFLN